MSCCFRSRCLLLFVSLVVLFYVPTARADVRLHTLFSDHMVLQRDRPVPVWGWATPGEAIAVSINKAASKTPVRDGKWRVKTTADRDGKWHLKLPAMKAGGTYKLTVVGKNTLTVSDVLVGEVWVCIGQSNMQVTLGRSHLAGQDVPKADDPLLRLGSMRAGVVACQPKSDAGFQWTASTPGSASAYSAVAYYYGRELREKLGVPVGLIQQSMGATDIECWTPEIGDKSIGKIKIFNRGDCCGERLAGAVVEVLDGKDKIVWSSKLTSVATGSVHQFGGGASIKLSAGLHPFVLNYHEGGGPPALKLLYQGPGIDRQEIPASVFFREEDQ